MPALPNLLNQTTEPTCTGGRSLSVMCGGLGSPKAVISDILLAIEMYMLPCIYSAMVVARDEAGDRHVAQKTS